MRKMCMLNKGALPLYRKVVADFSGREGIEFPKCANCKQPFLPKLTRFTREGLRVCPICFLKLGLKRRDEKEEGKKINKTRSLIYAPLPSPSKKEENIKVSMGGQ
jgi:hypothetical protein